MKESEDTLGVTDVCTILIVMTVLQVYTNIKNYKTLHFKYAQYYVSYTSTKLVIKKKDYNKLQSFEGNYMVCFVSNLYIKKLERKIQKVSIKILIMNQKTTLELGSHAETVFSLRTRMHGYILAHLYTTQVPAINRW